MAESDFSTSFQRRFRNGTDSVYGDLDRDYRQRLCALVARRMSPQLPWGEGPEDIAQSAFHRLWRYVREGKCVHEVKNPRQLWKLLTKIADRALLHRVEKIKAKKRVPDQALPLSEGDPPVGRATPATARLLGEVLEGVLTDVESPDSEIMCLQLLGYALWEIVDIVVDTLEPTYRQILYLRLQGLSQQAIATRLNMGREEVRSKLQRIVRRLSQVLRS